MNSDKPKRGRPTKPVEAGERASLGLRVTPSLKDRLEASAAASGRSQSQEAEFRLERSFADDGMFSSSEMKFWGVFMASTFHKEGAYHAAVRGHQNWTDKDWMNDPECRTAATFEVIDSLIKDLVRQPGADLDHIAIYVEDMKSRLLNNAIAAGKVRVVLGSDDQ
ncbi:TraY domain-containing protein [Mesorhizobium sp. IMUNJ 23033]|uniref:TraY domain-containing protein n=1 Tax=Mesorhizobium sp. IMUNJ 23033 TaxID=3378039 RepID=UPI00384C2887